MFRKQRGITLLEVLVSLGILATITTGIVALTNQQSEDTRASVTALHLKTVGDAANEYIKDNYASVTAVATATTPALIRISDLISGGYLNAGFNISNARSQNTCVLVLEPSANNLTGMVVTEAGDTIDDLTLGQIAATVGAAGGGIYSTAATTFRGAMGGWSTAIGNFANPNHLGQKCDGTAGAINLVAGHPVMALWFADGSSVSATLYRDPVPGNPTLNTMNTPILMGVGTVQTASSPCTTKGALGRDNDGKVLTCVDNAGTLEWTAAGGGSAYWGDPQSVGTNTPTQAQLDTALGVCSNTAPPKGRTHMVYGASGQPRPYICDGTDWQPVGVNLNGDLTVPGLLKASMLQPTYTATEGTSDANCVVADNTTWGRTAKDATGLLLSCQSGVWKTQTVIPPWNYVAPTLIYSEALNKPAHSATHTIDVGSHVPASAKFVSITTVILNGTNPCDDLFLASIGGFNSNGAFTQKNIPIKTYNQNSWDSDSLVLDLPISDKNLYFTHPYICGDTTNTGGSNILVYLNGYI